MPRWSLHVIGFIATTLILMGAAPLLGGPPWWFVAVLSVAAYAGGAIAFDRAVSRQFLRPWRTMGGVLDGASIEVHSVERDVPAPAGMEVAGHTGRSWCRLDVTIRPREARDATAPSRAEWDPTELALLDPSCEVDRNRETSLDLGTTVHGVELEGDEGFEPEAGRGCDGAARIRFLAALPVDMRYARLRYCLEVFGRIELAETRAEARQAA